jgi:hypothetical protein
MKKMIAWLAAAAVFAGVALLHAQSGGSCPACGTAGAAGTCPMSGKSDAISKLNLTDDQKAKITALREECAKAGRTPEACDKCMKGIEALLTPDQQKLWKETCEKAKQGGGCPVAGGAAGSCGS